MAAPLMRTIAECGAKAHFRHAAALQAELASRVTDQGSRPGWIVHFGHAQCLSRLRRTTNAVAPPILPSRGAILIGIQILAHK
jgi:hypothetical protein